MAIQQRFGQGPPPLSLGIEEELVVVDGRTLEQVGRAAAVVGALDGSDLPGRARTELHASVLELNTDPCASADEAVEALRRLRRAAREAAAEEGLALAATGVHPLSRAVAQPIVQEERYLTMVAHHGSSARRQNVQGLHVHIAVPSAEECWRVLEGMLPWLPVVLALSANSPWHEGELNGMASNRAPVLTELPRTGAPPALGSYAGWEAWVERLVRLGLIADYTRIWWDVRPHPALGTLEVRIPDQPTNVRLSGAFAALLQGLAAHLLGAERVEPADRSDYQYNRWAAARFGPFAELLAPDGERLAPASELAGELVALAAHDGAVAAVDPRGCEADLQSRFGDPVEATADIVARSLT